MSYKFWRRVEFYMKCAGFGVGVCMINYLLIVIPSSVYTYKHLAMNTCGKNILGGCICKGPYQDNDLQALAKDLERCEANE